MRNGVMRYWRCVSIILNKNCHIMPAHCMTNAEPMRIYIYNTFFDISFTDIIIEYSNIIKLIVELYNIPSNTDAVPKSKNLDPSSSGIISDNSDIMMLVRGELRITMGTSMNRLS